MTIFRTLFLILALLSNPGLTAYWDGPGAAIVSFTLSSRGCLSVEHATGQRVALTCREKAGTHVVFLGHGLTDGAYRPTAGDVYVLQTGGAVYRAPLRGRNVYFPLVRR